MVRSHQFDLIVPIVVLCTTDYGRVRQIFHSSDTDEVGPLTTAPSVLTSRALLF